MSARQHRGHRALPQQHLPTALLSGKGLGGPFGPLGTLWCSAPYTQHGGEECTGQPLVMWMELGPLQTQLPQECRSKTRKCNRKKPCTGNNELRVWYHLLYEDCKQANGLYFHQWPVLSAACWENTSFQAWVRSRKYLLRSFHMLFT